VKTKQIKERLKDVPKIFTITTINSNGGDTRCVGFFTTFSQAEKCVIENWGDIFEYYYDFAVVEEVTEGLYNCCQGDNYLKQWYKWNSKVKRYKKVKEPKFAKNIINWSIG
jgi:hypothetical protein